MLLNLTKQILGILYKVIHIILTPFCTIPVESNSSCSEKVWGFSSLGKLQQIVCEWRKVLWARGLGFVWCWRRRSQGSGWAAEGRLAADEPVWGWWGVTCSQRFVCVFAGSPVHEPLQGRGEGGAQAFRCKTAKQKTRCSVRTWQ